MHKFIFNIVLSKKGNRMGNGEVAMAAMSVVGCNLEFLLNYSLVKYLYQFDLKLLCKYMHISLYSTENNLSVTINVIFITS